MGEKEGEIQGWKEHENMIGATTYFSGGKTLE